MPQQTHKRRINDILDKPYEKILDEKKTQYFNLLEKYSNGANYKFQDIAASLVQSLIGLEFCIKKYDSKQNFYKEKFDNDLKILNYYFNEIENNEEFRKGEFANPNGEIMPKGHFPDITDKLNKTIGQIDRASLYIIMATNRIENKYF